MKYVLLVLMLMGKTAWCQNLVPNPSFEDISVCPTGDPESAVGWMMFQYTPDLYSSCNNGTWLNGMGVPYSFRGFQQPFSGNAYIGIFSNEGYREYLAAELTEPLVAGETYEASFYIAANSSPSYPAWTNKWGLKFINANYDNQPISLLTNDISHVYTDSVISDTAHWTKISGEFIADSSYKYVCIGNFFGFLQTTVVSSSALQSAYYYFDEVSVELKPTDESKCWKFQMFPNPADNVTNLTMRSGSEFVQVVNALGQTMFSQPVSSLHQSIDVSMFSEGVYFVQVRCHQGVQTQKFVVQR